MRHPPIRPVQPEQLLFAPFAGLFPRERNRSDHRFSSAGGCFFENESGGGNEVIFVPLRRLLFAAKRIQPPGPCQCRYTEQKPQKIINFPIRPNTSLRLRRPFQDQLVRSLVTNRHCKRRLDMGWLGLCSGGCCGTFESGWYRFSQLFGSLSCCSRNRPGLWIGNDEALG